MKTKISATIVADSINEQGDRLTSFLITFPRILLSEINTHRMLSKNTSSSRAIPFAKMVETIKNDPFIPIAWQKEHKGMQGTEYFTEDFLTEALSQNWLAARDSAIKNAEWLNFGGLTKQLCNRLLEPFMWTTMLITGPKSGWENFFNLRCPQYVCFDDDGDEVELFAKSRKEWIELMNTNHRVKVHHLQDYTLLDWLKINKGQAEIHMMALAECIWDAYNESTPQVLKAGEWHIPFEDKIDFTGLISVGDETTILNPMLKVKVSVALSARTSYTVVGEEKALDYEAMIGLHDKLLSQDPPHSSPMEHCSVCVSQEEYDISFKGQEKGWFRNYKGFKSYRQIIEESR